MELSVTKPWRYPIRWVTNAFGTRRIVVGVALIWLITGPMFRFSRGWLWLLSTGTAIATLLMLFVIVTARNRQRKKLSDKLNKLHDDLKTEKAMILRKVHARHRNGEDS
jgi:low affinity Fe/Cu permease